jgi:hypothetical protein
MMKAGSLTPMQASSYFPIIHHMLMEMDVLRHLSNNTMCHVMVLEEVQISLVDHLQSQRKYLRVKTKHFNGQNLSTYSNTLLMKLLQIRDHFIQQISCSEWFATMVASHYCFFFMRVRSSTVHSAGYSRSSAPSAAS